MSDGWKKWLIKSAGFGAGFALMLGAVAGIAAWYMFRPKPPKPWNRKAILAEFAEPATNDEKGTINLWYTLTNMTDADYRIDSLGEITTAALEKNDDALFGFNQGLSFEVPLIIPAHRKTVALVHVKPSVDPRLSVPDDGSANAIETYKEDVMSFFRSNYANWKGFAILDEGTRYEIDFPLTTEIASETSVRAFLSLPDDQKDQALDKLSWQDKVALLEGIRQSKRSAAQSDASNGKP